MRNKYKFFVDFGGDTLEFPVNPKEYSISYPTDHKTYNILDVGEIIVPCSPALMEVSWKSYFPGNHNDPLMYGHDWTDPEDCVEMILDARDNKEICDLVISRYDVKGSRMYDTNISAVIESFETTEKGGEAGDVYYEIKFKEYRDYAPIKVAIPQPEQTATVQIEEEQRPAAATAELRVGATVVANGVYYSSSFGDKPTGTANNLSTTVSRIIPDASRPYPILIGGSRGWIKADQLQVTG